MPKTKTSCWIIASRPNLSKLGFEDTITRISISMNKLVDSQNKLGRFHYFQRLIWKMEKLMPRSNTWAQPSVVLNPN